MSTLNTSAIADAVVALIKAADLSFAPAPVGLKLCQLGDLSHYAENPALSEDVPAVFVCPLGFELEGIDLEGELFWQTIIMRVMLCNRWEDGDNVWRMRQDQTDELVDKAIVREAGDDYRLSQGPANPIATGVEIESAIPSGVELTPPEHPLVAQDSNGVSRRLWATAFTLTVKARASR